MNLDIFYLGKNLSTGNIWGHISFYNETGVKIHYSCWTDGAPDKVKFYKLNSYSHRLRQLISSKRKQYSNVIDDTDIIKEKIKKEFEMHIMFDTLKGEYEYE